MIQNNPMNPGGIDFRPYGPQAPVVAANQPQFAGQNAMAPIGMNPGMNPGAYGPPNPGNPGNGGQRQNNRNFSNNNRNFQNNSNVQKRMRRY